MDRHDFVGPLQDDVCTGAVTGSDKPVGIQDHIGFDLKLHGTVFKDTFGCDVFQGSFKCIILDGADGQ